MYKNLKQRIEMRESFIVADDGQFLGLLSLNKYLAESILNDYGLFGNPYSVTSIYNKYSTYGSPYSSLSPYNQYTSTPPIIYLRGKRVGVLSKNPYLASSFDPDTIIDFMKYHTLF